MNVQGKYGNSVLKPLVMLLITLLWATRAFSADLLSKECYDQKFCIYVEREDISLFVYAESFVEYPITVTVVMGLEHIFSPVGSIITAVLPPKTVTGKVELLITDSANAKYNFELFWNRGDVNAPHEYEHVYYLPFTEGESYSVIEGYDDERELSNRYGVVFSMPEGTPITSVKSGIVVEVVENNQVSEVGETGEPTPVAPNYIVIEHNDRTLAWYFNLQFEGALVEVDDVVTQGQVIGLSGSTGYSNREQLYFIVTSPSDGLSLQSHPMVFQTAEGNVTSILKDQVYVSNHTPVETNDNTLPEPPVNEDNTDTPVEDDSSVSGSEGGFSGSVNTPVSDTDNDTENDVADENTDENTATSGKKGGGGLTPVLLIIALMVFGRRKIHFNSR